MAWKCCDTCKKPMEGIQIGMSHKTCYECGGRSDGQDQEAVERARRNNSMFGWKSRTPTQRRRRA